MPEHESMDIIKECVKCSHKMFKVDFVDDFCHACRNG